MLVGVLGVLLNHKDGGRTERISHGAIGIRAAACYDHSLVLAPAGTRQGTATHFGSSLVETLFLVEISMLPPGVWAIVVSKSSYSTCRKAVVASFLTQSNPT